MLEAEESCQTVSFASVSREGLTHEIPAKHSAWKILSVTFLPFTHTQWRSRDFSLERAKLYIYIY